MRDGIDLNDLNDVMMQHELLSIEQYPQHWGDIGVTIGTPRGVFTGVVDALAVQRAVMGVRQADLPGFVDIWHPVPRWMRPFQVVEPFLSL